MALLSNFHLYHPIHINAAPANHVITAAILTLNIPSPIASSPACDTSNASFCFLNPPAKPMALSLSHSAYSARKDNGCKPPEKKKMKRNGEKKSKRQESKKRVTHGRHKIPKTPRPSLLPSPL